MAWIIWALLSVLWKFCLMYSTQEKTYKLTAILPSGKELYADLPSCADWLPSHFYKLSSDMCTLISHVSELSACTCGLSLGSQTVWLGYPKKIYLLRTKRYSFHTHLLGSFLAYFQSKSQRAIIRILYSPLMIRLMPIVKISKIKQHQPPCIAQHRSQHAILVLG